MLSLTVEGCASLSQEILPQEIDQALDSMASDKAPGPDGLNVRSLKFLWPFLKQKIQSFIKDFQLNSSLPAGINSSFITLIPKIQNPEQIKDFRPISLINSSLKILLKILATRLAKQMGNLIGDSQSGFIKGRQASDNILLVKEVVHSIQKRRAKGLILKLDFEKAFDIVNWDFLLSTMEAMKFNSKWCSWIKSILGTTRISVLINGSPTNEFSLKRGLRQGDPLSPLLYNLVGEVLNSMLNCAAKKGLFKGIRLANS